MATQTTRLLLRKPDPDPSTGDLINVVTDINDSMDKIDAAMGFHVCTSGTRPVGTQRWDGRQIHETDTRRNYMWSAALAEWLPMLISRHTNGPYLLGTSTDINGEGFNVETGLASADVWRSRVVADANPRFILDTDGGMRWGPGVSATDTSLYRSAADTLKTDDDLVVGGNLTVTSFNSGVPVKVYDNILGVTTTTVGPINVPTSGYRSLLLEVMCRSDAAQAGTSLRVRFNSDSTNIYHSQADYGQTGTSNANEIFNTSSAELMDMAAATAPAGMAGYFSIRVPWYRGPTFFKELTYTSAQPVSAAVGGQICRNGSAIWRSTSPISTITFLPVNGSFVAGSSFAIYALP